jgi:hypothetical protein
MLNTISQIKEREATLQLNQQRLAMQTQDRQVLADWMSTYPTWESRQAAEPPTLLLPESVRVFNSVVQAEAGGDTTPFIGAVGSVS